MQRQSTSYFRPNFYIAISISNEDIISRVSELHGYISGETRSYDGAKKRAFTRVGQLHVTVFVTQLDGPEQIKRAQKAFKECCQIIDREVDFGKLKLTVEGLGHFGDRILFAKVGNNKEIAILRKMSSIFKENFETLGFAVDSRPYVPHLTISNLNRLTEQERKDIRLYPTEIWDDLKNFYFGEDVVGGLKLLSMIQIDPEKKDRCYAEYSFISKTRMFNRRHIFWIPLLLIVLWSYFH